MTTNCIIDEEFAFYVRHSIDVGTLEDMRRAFYLANITSPDTDLTNDDLEVDWLKEESSITTTNNASDLWYQWLSPTYGDLTVDDLKLQYYINN
jgi:hypothetical protein